MKKIFLSFMIMTAVVLSSTSINTSANNLDLKAVIFEINGYNIALSRINYYMAVGQDIIGDPNYNYVELTNGNYYSKINYYMSLGSALSSGQTVIDGFNKLATAKNIELSDVAEGTVNKDTKEVISREFKVIDIK